MNAMKVFRTQAQVTPIHGDNALTIDEVGKCMSTAMSQGDGVVCIVSGSQRRQLERQMDALGVDVVGALMRDQLVFLNAFDALMKVIVNNVTNVVRFAEIVGAVVDRAAARYPRVLTFSGLASVSLKNGNMSGVRAFETLLRSFLDSRPVIFRSPSRAFCLEPNATRDYRSIQRMQSRAAVSFT